MVSLLNSYPTFFPRSRLSYISASTALIFLFVIWILLPSSTLRPAPDICFQAPSSVSFNENTTTDAIRTISDYFQAYKLNETRFGELGSRLQVLRRWINLADQQHAGSVVAEAISTEIEKYAQSEFPFLTKASVTSDRKPLDRLRRSYVPGSKGIVIPAGKGNFRYTCHLISCLRHVHHSSLPIQVAYAGDSDLPAQYRSFIESMGRDIETFNVLDFFDDATLDLGHGGWAIKPFAMLASKFEQTILADADAVFVQSPEVIFDSHTGYRDAGALLFHDRLLWKGAFKERHEFWEHEMEHHVPSETLRKSKVYMEGYAEEGDSGVVAVDKSRLALFVGLLHVCWQNTKLVRERVTYQQGYGDKETWWFGLELSNAPYSFEDHYGAIVGHEMRSSSDDQNEGGDGTTTKVCSFTIAHVGQHEKLLWYNGSLLKNKATNKTDFSVPTHWMIGGVWMKGITKSDLSCMKDAEVRSISDQDSAILAASVKAAQAMDRSLVDLVNIEDS